VPLTSDPVLTVWRAMNLLNDVDLESETPEISSILAEAEITLFRLVTVLVRRTKETGTFSSTGRVIPH
jgi:hypothetical protein